MKTMLTMILTVCSTLFAVAASAEDYFLKSKTFPRGSLQSVFGPNATVFVMARLPQRNKGHLR